MQNQWSNGSRKSEFSREAMRSLKFATRLLESTGNVNGTDKYLKSSLHYLVIGEKFDFVKHIINLGGNVNAIDKTGYSPLHYAVKNGNADLVHLLLSAGADINIRVESTMQGTNEGPSPLQVAIKTGQVSMVRLLLENGANPNARSFAGKNLLFRAARLRADLPSLSEDDHLEMLRLLLDHGADVGLYALGSRRPLNAILRYGSARAVRLFLSRGADLRSLGYASGELLNQAAMNADGAVLRLLLESGLLDLAEARRGWARETPLHKAAAYGRAGNAKRLVRRLGLSVDARNGLGRTPLHQAALHGHAEAARLLIRLGADASAKDRFGLSVLGAALSSEPRGSGVARLVLAELASCRARDRQCGGEELELLLAREPELREYFDACEAELRAMRDARLGGSVSLLDILMAEDLACYARNRQLVRSLESREVSREFFIYGQTLLDRFEKELKRQKLLREAMEACARIARWDVDALRLPIERIVSYMSKQDMLKLRLV